MVGTNVYCDLCGTQVVKDDSFVVETDEFVRAFHLQCGAKISLAFRESLDRARGQEFVPGEHQSLQHESMASWKQREMEERLEALEDLTRKVASVWRLWLNDAESGSINPGTFDAMKHLLGIEKA